MRVGASMDVRVGPARRQDPVPRINGWLYLRHGKGAGASAAGAARQSPIASDRVPVHAAGKGESIPRRRSGRHGHAELAAYLTVKVPAEREGTALSLARCEARRVRAETEIRDTQGAVIVDRHRRAKGESGRTAAAHKVAFHVPLTFAEFELFEPQAIKAIPTASITATAKCFIRVPRVKVRRGAQARCQKPGFR